MPLRLVNILCHKAILLFNITLQPGKNIKIANKDDETTITVQVAKRPDRGEYNLKLKNDLGEDNASVSITVLGKYCITVFITGDFFGLTKIYLKLMQDVMAS